VLRVLPGMQAAFVEMGLEKAAFMHVSDFWRAPGADGSDGPSGEMQSELDLEPSLAAYAEDLEADAITESAAALASAPEADAAPAVSRTTPTRRAAKTSSDAADAHDDATLGRRRGPRGRRQRSAAARAAPARRTPMPSIEEV
jgi:ribonuclease G